MLNTWNVLVSQSNYPDLYQIDDRDSMLAKSLYNAAMFRIRQTFTGWDKTSRTDHENEVFEEIRITKQTYPGLKIKRVLSQWIGGYCGRPCIGTDRLLCHICMASALTVKPDRSNRNRRDTPSIAIAMGGELHDRIQQILEPISSQNAALFEKTIEGLTLRDGITKEKAMSYFTLLERMFNGYFAGPAVQQLDMKERIALHEKTAPLFLEGMLFGIARKEEANQS